MVGEQRTTWEPVSVAFGLAACSVRFALAAPARPDLTGLPHIRCTARPPGAQSRALANRFASGAPEAPAESWLRGSRSCAGAARRRYRGFGCRARTPRTGTGLPAAARFAVSSHIERKALRSEASSEGCNVRRSRTKKTAGEGPAVKGAIRFKLSLICWPWRPCRRRIWPARRPCGRRAAGSAAESAPCGTGARRP